MNLGFAGLRNGQAFPREKILSVRLDHFRRTIAEAVAGGQHIAALFGDAPDATGPVYLYAVLADPAHALLRVGMTRLDRESFPSLTPECPQVHLFERELAEQFGIRPEGHPWLKPVRYHL